MYGFHGPNFTTTSACASSSNAIADAFNYIRLGKASFADRNQRKPNALQNAATELFNEINNIREEISKGITKIHDKNQK